MDLMTMMAYEGSLPHFEFIDRLSLDDDSFGICNDSSSW